ncbi:MAG: hypothetical protein ACRD1Y_01645 [Terriglobales bacterium]
MIGAAITPVSAGIFHDPRIQLSAVSAINLTETLGKRDSCRAVHAAGYKAVFFGFAHALPLRQRVEKLLVKNADTLRIYQRAGEVVRIVELDAKQERGPLRKEAGTASSTAFGDSRAVSSIIGAIPSSAFAFFTSASRPPF